MSVVSFAILTGILIIWGMVMGYFGKWTGDTLTGAQLKEETAFAYYDLAAVDVGPEDDLKDEKTVFAIHQAEQTYGADNGLALNLNAVPSGPVPSMEALSAAISTAAPLATQLAQVVAGSAFTLAQHKASLLLQSQDTIARGKQHDLFLQREQDARLDAARAAPVVTAEASAQKILGYAGGRAKE